MAKDMLDLQPEALAELIRNYAREVGGSFLKPFELQYIYDLFLHV